MTVWSITGKIIRTTITVAYAHLYIVSSYNFRFGLIFYVSRVSYLFFSVKVKFCVSLCVYMFMCVHCLERLSPRCPILYQVRC